MTRPLRYLPLWQTLGWLMLTIVLVLSLMPHPPKLDLPRLLQWDKAQHALAYATLTVWFQQCTCRRWQTPLLLLGIGIAVEYLQRWSGYRDFEYADMLADALGIVGGLLVVHFTPLGRLVQSLDRLTSACLRAH